MSDPPPPTRARAGWYSDPGGGPGYRWWDGSNWTEAMLVLDHQEPTQPPRPAHGAGSDQPKAPDPANPGPTGDRGQPGPAGPSGQPGGGPWPTATQPTGRQPGDGGPGGQSLDEQWRQGPHPPGQPLPPAPEAPTSLLGPVGLWINESFRLVVDRAGHLLPFALFGVLIPGLAASVALWFANRNITFVVNPENDPAEPFIERGYEGSVAPIAATLAALALLMLTGLVVRAATIRQVWTTKTEQPEPWTASLAAIGRRWRSVLWVAVARLGFVAAVVALAVLSWNVLPENWLTTLTVLGPALMLFVWWRFSLSSQAAVLGPPGTRSLTTGWQLSRRDPVGLLGRLLMLALVASSFFLMFRFVGNLTVDLVGETPDEATESSPLADVDLATFALARAFGLFGLGAAAFQMLTASGLTLLYLRLDGPVDETERAMASDDDEPDPDGVWPDSTMSRWGGDLDG